MTKNENMRFILRVTAAHMVTYFICGAFFATVLNYESVWQSGIFAHGMMRDYNSIWITLGPFLQVFRGLLFGGILLLIPKEFYGQKYAWLKLWCIVAGIGIINTPGPGNGSIEGFIYTEASLQAHGLYSIEIFVQTLWFSWWVCRRKKEKTSPLNARFTLPLACAGVTLLSTSALGVVISVVNGVDVMAPGGPEPSAMITLLLMAVMIFLAVLWYRQNSERSGKVFLCACYLINALPTMIYNFILDSSFRSADSLFTAIVPTFLIWLIARKKSKQPAQ